MPELPEVEAICQVVQPAVGNSIKSVKVIRGGKYLAADGAARVVGRTFTEIFRRGKRVMFHLDDGMYIDCHNAMSGFWDFKDDPWCFDYVEAARHSASNDVRVLITLSNDRVMQFHDTRLFGWLKLVSAVPTLGPELLSTSLRRGPVIDEQLFYSGLRRTNAPIKHMLMDQAFLAGVGNIYSNEGCHIASIDPRMPSHFVGRLQSAILLDALRTVVSICIPKISYGWRHVYRTQSCGSCGGDVSRAEVKGRATFWCNRCQP